MIKIRKIKAYAHYGYVGAYREKITEFDDDATDEEIDETIWEWATSYIGVDKEEIEEN